MSLLFGFCHTDQKPAEETTLATMYEGIKDFPNEKHAFLIKKNVGFAHALTYNTPEALFENMPKYVAEQRLIFTAEGRLDNREELASLLEIRLNNESGGVPLPDGEIMLKAYQKWGKNAADKLLGDWSFACFDESTQELFLARDKHGYTALFYHFDNNTFSFATSKKSLLKLANVKKNINKEKLIRGLAIWFHPKNTLHNETHYEGIFSVPPAHTLTFRNGKIELNRYWFPEKTETIYRKNPQDYADELLDILTKATKARLRTYKPVASMLSGGLDSSSVSVLAAELLAKQGKHLTTLSHVPLFKEELKLEKSRNQVLDETPFIMASVEKAGNIDPILLNSSHFTPTEGMLKAIDCHDGVFHAGCNAYWLVDIMETAQRNGYGSLLSGEMGNAGISYTGVDYHLPFGHPSFMRNPKKLLKSKILKPIALQYFPKLMEKRGNGGIENYILETGYLNKNIIEEWQIIEDIRKNNNGFSPYFANTQAGMLAILDVGNNPRCMFGANSKHYYGIEKRDPTGDVRVLEHCLSVPNEAFFDKFGNKKQLLKNTMKNRLPDKVLFEKKKGLQSSDIAYRALAQRDTITEILHDICQNPTFQEIVDTKRLQADWQAMSKDSNANVLHPQTIMKTMMVGCFLEREK
jgi:asparagine synthase (glutamine-hydrolysing)